MSIDIETIGVGFDTSGLKAGEKALKDVGKAADQTADSADKTGKRFDALSSTANLLKGAFVALGGAMLIKEFVQAADSVALMDARLKLATTSTKDFEQAQRDVYRIAQINSAGLVETASLYTKLSEPVRNLGGSTKEVAGIVEAFSATLRISGATASETDAAIMQMGQAMGSGKLSGDEFNRMAESSPRFLKAMAEGLKVPVGALKEMGADGKLTADIVGNALIGSLQKLRTEAASMPQTVGGSFTRIKNDILLAADEINKNSGVTASFNEALDIARQLIPTVRDELAGAFQSVGQWVGENRDQFAEIWESSKQIVSEVWELAKGAASVVGFFADLVLKSGAIKNEVLAVRLLFAGLQDGITFLGGAFAALGSIILKNIAYPLQVVLQSSAMVAGVFDEKLGARISAISASIREFTDGGEKYGDSVVDAFARGDTAVSRVLATLSDVKTATDSVKGSSNQAADSYEKLAGATGLDKEAQRAANREREKQASLLANLSGVNADYVEQLTRLQIIREKSNMSDERYVDLVKELIAKQPGVVKMLKEQADASKEADRFLKDYAENSRAVHDAYMSQHLDALESTREELQANRDLAKTIGLKKSEIEAATVARLEEQLAQRASTGMTLDEIEAIKNLLTLKKQNSAALANIEDIEQQLSVWKSIEQTAHDTFVSIATGGKNVWQRLKDSAKNIFFDWLYQMTLKKWIIQVGAAFTGGSIPGMANAAPGGVGPGNLGSMLSNGASFLNGSMINYGATKGVTGVANWMMDSSNSTVQSMGASLGSNAGWLSQGAGMLGNGLAGYGISKALSGGYSAGGWVNAAAGIASAIPGIGPIAGVIGAAINRAFGMKAKELGATTLNGSFGANGFSGTQDTAWTQKGGWFRSDKSGVDKTAVDGSMALGFTQGYDALKAAAADYAKVLGLNADLINGRTQTLSIALTKDQAANEKAIAEFFVGVGNNIASELLPSLDSLRAGSETASQTLQRLAVNYVGLDQLLSSMQMTFGAVGESSLAARERLITAAGGLDALAQNVSGFQQNFYTEAERLVPVAAMVTAEMSKLGLASVDTAEEFRATVMGLRLNTEEGGNMYASLMKLQGAFAAVHPLIDKSAEQEQQRLTLQTQLDSLIMTSEQMREKERNAIFESNRAIFDQIQAINAKAAAEVKATESLQAATDWVMEIRGLNRNLITESATTIQAIGAQAMSFEDLSRVAMAAAYEQQQKAIEQHRTAMKGLTDNILEEAGRLRKTDQFSSTAQLGASFAMATARARAGDMEALKSLPGLSQALELRARQQSTNLADFRRVRAYTATSLTNTANMAGSGNGSVGADTALLVKAIEGLRQELAEVKKNTKTTADTLNTVTNGGEGMINA